MLFKTCHLYEQYVSLMARTANKPLHSSYKAVGYQLFQGTISYLQAQKSIQLSSTAVLEVDTGTLEQAAQPLHVTAFSEGKPV